ncbi:MAG: EAL domain-containing protein [Deltaproteobacteria bacterium]|nr:EAL domain-containing protein [Deltaproteobacteria bacterium]
MNVLSVASLFATYFYVYCLGYVLSLSGPRLLRVSFAALSLLFAAWAFPYVFMLSASTKAEYFAWLPASEMAGAAIPGLVLYFLLVLSGMPRRRLRLIAPVLIVVTAVFVARAATGTLFAADAVRGPLGWVETSDFGSPWTVAVNLWYLLCAGGGLWHCRSWGRRTSSAREKAQATIILRTGVAMLALIGLSVTVLPALGDNHVPSTAHLAAAIWVVGIFRAITRHGLMTLTAGRAVEAMVRSMPDGLLLLDLRGRVVAANESALRMVGWSNPEAHGKRWVDLLAPGRGDAERLTAAVGGGPVPHFETEVRRKDGAVVPVVLSVSVARDHFGDPRGIVAVVRDETERLRAEERLRHMAHHDALTGLPNRLLFRDRLEQGVVRARRYDHAVGVLALDFDRLKEVNDRLGHEAGDELLRGAAARLGEGLGAGDTLARTGGDEFALVCAELAGVSEAEAIARRILESFVRPFTVGGREWRASASVGVAVFPDHGRDGDELLRRADLALYEAKGAGRNGFRVWSPTLGRIAQAGRKLGERLRRALAEKQFLLHYQPQVDLASGEVVAVEALVRWLDPERGLVAAAEFLPVAEETGLIEPLGEWVLRTACAQNAAWRAAGLPRVPVTVNISPRQLLAPGLVERIREALERTRLAPEDLEVEVTEDAARQDARQAAETLRGLRDLGVGLAIDDLGTGRTSLLFLTAWPGRTLKIGQALVRDLGTAPENRTIVEGILALARAVGVERVVAEGVESAAQADLLRTLGCRAAQGYYFARPATAQACATFLARKAEAGR